MKNMWVNSIAEANLPDKLIALMSDASLLSMRLKTKCNNLSVQVNSQKLSSAFPSEQELLDINEGNSLIRKVHLCGDGEPWIHGRVVVPYNTYLAFKLELDNLGSKLLGETLLNNRADVTRSAFQFSQITASLWGRRSIFRINNYKLLVTEIFLPALMAK